MAKAAPFIPAAPAVPVLPAAVDQMTNVPPQAVMPVPTQLKPKKIEIPSTQNKVIGAKIILQFRGEDGQIYDSVTTVSTDEYKVQSYSLQVEEKHEKKRDPETKDLTGFEDTGERILKFSMRYHVR